MVFSKEKNSFVYDYLIIIVGVLLIAAAVSVFFEPCHLVTGGVSGLAIVIQSVSREMLQFEIPLWISNTLLNVPLFIIGTKIKGFSFLKKTLFATVFLSVSLYIIDYLPKLYEMDILLSAVFGGVLMGIGLGLVFRCGATTGGSDLAASILAKFNPHISVAKIMLVIDAVIILIGLFVFGFSPTMYAIISVYITSRVIDAVLEGLSFAKAAFIISEKHMEIGERLLTELDRGATLLNGTGMYTKKQKNVILCVVSSKEIVVLKRLVYEADKNAFVIVADVREVVGEGFTGGFEP